MRDRMRRGGALAAVLVALCACAPEPQPVLRESLLVFGGPAQITVYDAAAADARAAVADIAARLSLREREWHAWRDSDLTRINAAFAAGEAAAAPASVRTLLQRSRVLVPATMGLYDPTIGGLVRLWGFHTGDFPLRTPPPADAEIEAWLAASPSIADIHIDGERVHSDDPAAQLDFGAIAEGAAAAEAADILLGRGIDDALVSIGGDLYALGRAGDRDWQLAIRDAHGAAADGLLARVPLRDREALFSSGNYEKYRPSPGGERWPHVLDPRTGRPARGAAAASVLHPDPLLADVAATALMIGGAESFDALVQSLGLGCAMLQTADDTVRVTRPLAARWSLLRQPATLVEHPGARADCGAPRNGETPGA